MNDKILTFEEYTMNDDFSSIRINEMAISLKDYRDKMDAYRIRLVENWFYVNIVSYIIKIIWISIVGK